MIRYINYSHNGTKVWVNEKLQGKHIKACLCYQCSFLNTNDKEKNCPIAQSTYENCIKYNITTPIWECPNFKLKGTN